ncbi:ATP-binding protein [Roseovarius aestuarii]|nr:ATP-binding protein [Roseovarius aestuarii]
MHETANDSVFSLIASQEGVRDGLLRIRRFLDASFLDQNACGILEIVLAEALNNVVEHAYDMCETGAISVALQLRIGGTSIDILDNGAAMAGNTLPEGRLPPLDCAVHNLPEGGFGWALIRSQTDALWYRRTKGRNHLHMHLPHRPA